MGSVPTGEDLHGQGPHLELEVLAFLVVCFKNSFLGQDSLVYTFGCYV